MECAPQSPASAAASVDQRPSPPAAHDRPRQAHAAENYATGNQNNNGNREAGAQPLSSLSSAASKVVQDDLGDCIVRRSADTTAPSSKKALAAAPSAPSEMDNLSRNQSATQSTTGAADANRKDANAIMPHQSQNGGAKKPSEAGERILQNRRRKRRRGRGLNWGYGTAAATTSTGSLSSAALGVRAAPSNNSMGKAASNISKRSERRKDSFHDQKKTEEPWMQRKTIAKNITTDLGADGQSSDGMDSSEDERSDNEYQNEYDGGSWGSPHHAPETMAQRQKFQEAFEERLRDVSGAAKKRPGVAAASSSSGKPRVAVRAIGELKPEPPKNAPKKRVTFAASTTRPTIYSSSSSESEFDEEEYNRQMEINRKKLLEMRGDKDATDPSQKGAPSAKLTARKRSPFDSDSDDDSLDQRIDKMRERERKQREEKEAKERAEREARERAEREVREAKERKRREEEEARKKQREEAEKAASAARRQWASASGAASAPAASSAASSGNVATYQQLQAAYDAYNAIPSVQKEPAASVAPAYAHGRSMSGDSDSDDAYESDNSPLTSKKRPAIKSEEADGSICHAPKIKADPDGEDGTAEEIPDIIIGETISNPSAKVHSSSFWQAVAVKQEDRDEWRREVEERKEKEDRAMSNTIEGRAYKFVEAVLQRQKELATGDSAIDELINPVARDDMVFMTEKMLRLQAQFVSDGRPGHVNIGYHYTRAENMNRIRTDGLMTHAERQASSVNSLHNGSVFGDGVYTGDNPFAFQAYGDTGLVAARLQGVTERSDRSLVQSFIGGGQRQSRNKERPDTVIGNKMMRGTNPRNDDDKYYDEVVLQKSAQIIPLICFHKSLADSRHLTGTGTQSIHMLHVEMQKIVDDFFNGGNLTWVKDYSIPQQYAPPPMPMGLPGGLPFGVGGGALFGLPGAGMVPFMGAGNVLGHAPCKPIAEIDFVAPYMLEAPSCAYEVIEDVSKLDDECIICLDNLKSDDEKVAKVKLCGHMFHINCIEESLKHKNQCPTCRRTIGEVRGEMPSGTMTITKSRTKCKGYERCGGSLIIDYNIPSDEQRVYMMTPGAPFVGKRDTAYLPDNKEGRQLLERLKYAFSRGLTFVVGTSATTGQSNVVTWATIHHKTSPRGGPHGFPDPNYISNCNEELDNCGVPTADECKEANGGDSSDESDDDDSTIVID